MKYPNMSWEEILKLEGVTFDYVIVNHAITFCELLVEDQLEVRIDSAKETDFDAFFNIRIDDIRLDMLTMKQVIYAVGMKLADMQDMPLRDDWISFPQFGSWYSTKGGVLYQAPMNPFKHPIWEQAGIVTDEVDQNFLSAINSEFDTVFTLSDFGADPEIDRDMTTFSIGFTKETAYKVFHVKAETSEKAVMVAMDMLLRGELEIEDEAFSHSVGEQ